MSSNCQGLTFPRRALPGKLLAITSLLLLPKPLTPKAQSTSEFQPKPLITQDYPLPEFSIGDLVASNWEGYEDEDKDEDIPVSFTDFGEVLGMRWVPEPDYCSLSANTWVYFVRWTHSTCKACAYPCYDGEPTEGSALRLVKQLGGQK